jgi:hypothetical protein
MSGTLIAFIAASCISSGTLVGLIVNRMLPEHHLSDESKDAIKVGAGMISLMSALVLGLLVSSAKSTFDSTGAAVKQNGADVLVMDYLLADYGPEAKGVREELRQALATAVQTLWPEESSSDVFLHVERNTTLQKLLEDIRVLSPQTEAQRALQAQAQTLGIEILRTRWLQIEQAQVSLPLPFLIILLIWLTLLYMSFGLLAPHNATVITTLFLSGLALASALFLIIDMSQPMEGAIKISSGPLRKVLQHLSQ